MNSYIGSARGSQRFFGSALGRTVWRMPFAFQVAKLAGPPYTLRCLLFHDISDKTSVFTKGLNVTIGREDFESRIHFVTENYDLMGLQEFIDAFGHKLLPARPALVTFDDAYASVALNAAPVLHRYKIPAVFFVISSLVGNTDLGLDNLICYVANTDGFKAVQAAAQEALHRDGLELNSLDQVFDRILPFTSLEGLQRFRHALESAAKVCSADLARETQLYVSSDQLNSLASDGFEIGNHTLSHVYCRSMVGDEFNQQIDACKTNLESLTRKKVRAFSVPYGSPLDLTKDLTNHLRESGHEVVFLARNRSNTPTTGLHCLNRIDVHAGSDGDTFGEIEILPRLRTLADRILGRNVQIRRVVTRRAKAG